MQLVWQLVLQTSEAGSKPARGTSNKSEYRLVRFKSSALGAENREFESLYSDQKINCPGAGNWKTGSVENAVTQDVWVRIPLGAPVIS